MPLESARAKAPARPAFSAISQAVHQYFASLEDYKPGDLISQSQVQAALQAVAKAGWEIPDTRAIAKRAVADDSFLMKELSSSSGKPFMRRIAKYPGAYNCLDRLSTISEGHDVVRRLIDLKGGDVMIQYMVTTKGGVNLSHMMAGVPDGVDLNKPTDRIYTSADLLTVLKLAYGKSNR